MIGETQGEHSLQRTYDEAGNCIRLKSSLSADLAFDHDKQGNLESIKSGDQWHADWQRDHQGLELHRSLSGGISVRTERDGFGREIQKSVGVHNLEKSRHQYHWGIGYRLMGINNEQTGAYTSFASATMCLIT